MVAALDNIRAKVDEALAAFTAKFKACFERQADFHWTTPELSKDLSTTEDAVAVLATSIALAFSFDASAGGSGESSSSGGSGRPTDALSLGVGVSAAAAAKISAGISLGIGVSASTSLLAQLVVGLHECSAAQSNLDSALVEFNAESSAKAGAKGTLAPGQKADKDKVNKAMFELNSKVSACQKKANAANSGKPVSPITAELSMDRVGAWHCELDLDQDTKPDGKVKFKLDDLEFVGTVIPANTGRDGARARCKVVGGNGHLSATVSAHSYSSSSGVKVGQVVRDILKECGEDLSDLSDGPTLNKKLARWHTMAGTAQQNLTRLAEACDGSWRVMRDGSVWFGAETWPEVAPAGTLVGEDWHEGCATLASETPNMVPGTVYQGQRIQHVVHRYGEKLRTEIRTTSPQSALSKVFAGRKHEIDYSREYPCKVVTQNPDGTLQLLPDDAIMRASGLDKVPIRYGLPGFRARVKNGARCHLAFAAGDPSRPFAHNWEDDPDGVESVSFVVNGREAALARVGDQVKVFFTTLPTGFPFTGLVGGVAASGFIMIATPMYGVIDTGNPSIRG